jgi:hypothetical protein
VCPAAAGLRWVDASWCPTVRVGCSQGLVLRSVALVEQLGVAGANWSGSDAGFDESDRKLARQPASEPRGLRAVPFGSGIQRRPHVLVPQRAGLATALSKLLWAPAGRVQWSHDRLGNFVRQRGSDVASGIQSGCSEVRQSGVAGAGV